MLLLTRTHCNVTQPMSGAMDADLSNLLEVDPYLQLDDSIRLVVSRNEWNFMTDSQRATFERELCEPDPE